MPSRSEPCGLAQMIASGYGTVPVVRETGGLYDTIKPYFEKTTKTGRISIQGNGFTFQTYNAHDMLDAIDRALSVYRVPEKWDKLVKRVMKADFSWNTSAEEYVKTYSNML
jgi:starch synthase